MNTISIYGIEDINMNIIFMYGIAIDDIAKYETCSIYVHVQPGKIL